MCFCESCKPKLPINMKYLLPFLLSILACVPTVYGQSSADEQAIRSLIDAETKAFASASFADVAKQFWILDDKTVISVTLIDCLTLHMRTSDILESTVVPEASQSQIQKSDFVILINGNMASAYHHQVVTITETGEKIKSHELRILEKVNGTWKFHMSTVQQYKLGD
jgi:hypothetical protein